MSVEWLLLTSSTSVKPTQWLCVVISRTVSLGLCHGLVLLAEIYFHIYLQESTVIFLLHFQSSNISCQNHNFILPVFPLPLSNMWSQVHPPAWYFSYVLFLLAVSNNWVKGSRSVHMTVTKCRPLNLRNSASEKKKIRVLKRWCLPCSGLYTIIYGKHLPYLIKLYWNKYSWWVFLFVFNNLGEDYVKLLNDWVKN